MLNHEDVLKLEELGWIEYELPIRIYLYNQLSIKVNSIEMVYLYLLII